MTVGQRRPELYLSMAHPCSYLAGRASTIIFVDPRRALDNDQYGEFVRQGFRRSGDLVYRPYCQDCAACVPVRIPVSRFVGSRGQRRIWRRNADLIARERPAAFDPDHFALYRRYIAGRHPGSSMDDPDPERYWGFLVSKQVNTVFVEFRHRDANALVCVAATDLLPDGLSAVYTFFDPDTSHRGLGVYAVLWQIEEARRRGLSYVYLGYWIRESPKMSYKSNFQPLESLIAGQWLPFPA
jgi:arginine-tRNA-protein transferase